MSKCRFMHPVVYWREILRPIAAPFTARNFFWPLILSQARQSECSATTACISQSKGLKSANRMAAFCSPEEQSYPLSWKHCRMSLAHDSPATLNGIKRQTTYIIVIVIYSWRWNPPLAVKAVSRLSLRSCPIILLPNRRPID